ncbi:nucleoside-diphosphate kinase [Vibrio sp. D431a]|uniref:nucleoside-diphosphate kinase n=1 Tax=Vibrio sp. D431a TaxID=2837388 RepID=UPI002555651B|nr:nucleoside-diphosphate kinase [Vibrio sp. D431a]MDK9793254.1 nucleoside-diphosphate kinase [Vibrio sp. D431a]
MEKTLGLIKPCAVSKGLDSEIFEKIKESGLRVVSTKRLKMTDEIATEFYAEHREKGFFGVLKDFMTSGEIVAFIIEGEDVVLRYRKLMGATNPADAEDGTLRKMYAESLDHNAVHGSDSTTSAQREISIIFG